MSLEFYSRGQKKFLLNNGHIETTMGWWEGKERKYSNKKHHIDKELTDYVISKLKWQCVVTGKKHLSQGFFRFAHVYLYAKINTRTLKKKRKKNQKPSKKSDSATFCLETLLLVHLSFFMLF